MPTLFCTGASHSIGWRGLSSADDRCAAAAAAAAGATAAAGRSFARPSSCHAPRPAPGACMRRSTRPRRPRRKREHAQRCSFLQKAAAQRPAQGLPQATARTSRKAARRFSSPLKSRVYLISRSCRLSIICSLSFSSATGPRPLSRRRSSSLPPEPAPALDVAPRPRPPPAAAASVDWRRRACGGGAAAACAAAVAPKVSGCSRRAGPGGAAAAAGLQGEANASGALTAPAAAAMAADGAEAELALAR